MKNIKLIKNSNKMNPKSLLIFISLSIILVFTMTNPVSAFAKGFGDTCAGLSAGDYHTCILKTNGNVECYGDNYYGQSEDYTGGDAIGVSAGDYHTCILKTNGNVECYGDNNHGQSENYTGGDAVGVSAGGYHTCILKTNGNVECYGYNYMASQGIIRAGMLLVFQQEGFIPVF